MVRLRDLLVLALSLLGSACGERSSEPAAVREVAPSRTAAVDELPRGEQPLDSPRNEDAKTPDAPLSAAEVRQSMQMLRFQVEVLEDDLRAARARVPIGAREDALYLFHVIADRRLKKATTSGVSLTDDLADLRAVLAAPSAPVGPSVRDY